MVLTAVMGRVSYASRWMLCCTLLTLSLGNQLHSQMICDDLINVSLGHPVAGDCQPVEITPDLILEGMIGANCDYNVEISNGESKACSADILEIGNYSVTITNISTGNNCWGNINVEDKLAPKIDGACDVTLSSSFLCLDVAGTIPVPEYSDCSEVTVSWSDSFTGADCTSSSRLTRTWIFTDEYNNVSTCQRIYTYAPYDPANPPADFAINFPIRDLPTLPCGYGTSPEDIYTFFYNEYIESIDCSDNMPEGETYSESCDPESDHFNEVYIANAKAYAIKRSYPHILTGTDPDTGVPTYLILDGNICNTFTSYDDLVLPICEGVAGCEDENNKVIRTWEIYNWCDASAPPISESQVIKAADTEPPVIEVVPFATSVDPWGCTTKLIFPEPAILKDKCSSYVGYSVSTGSGTGSGSAPGIVLPYDPDLGYYAPEVEVGNHVYYYNAFDCCGNTTTVEVPVSVQDATPPVAITKQDIVISLVPSPGNPGEPGITKMFAGSVDNGSFDGCGDIKLEIRRDVEACGILSNLTFNNDTIHSNDDTLDLDDGKFIQFCCNDLVEFGVDENGDGINDYAQIKVWLRVWDDGDSDGEFGSQGDNYSEVWSYVRLEDKSRPTIVCPADININCDGDVFDMSLMGRAQGYNSCGDMGTSYLDENFLTRCDEGTIERTWFVLGNEDVNCVQTIGKDGVDPNLEIVCHFPKDTVINCFQEYDALPFWENAGPCDQMAIDIDRDTFLFVEGACYKILNRWTVINWCDYEPNDPDSDAGIWSHVQVVKIHDEVPPEILNCTEAVAYAGDDCTGPVTLTNSAMDSGVCASNLMRWEIQVWAAEEYTFSSNFHPSSEFYVAPTASGEEVSITLPEGVQLSSVEHKVLWRVTDGCGNRTSCTTYFNIVDNIPPTPYCVNLSTALMETGTVELWACDFDLGAFDNCTDHDDLRFTFSDVLPSNDDDYNELAKCSAKTFTCADILNPAGSLVTLGVYVWDENNNYDFCTVFLTLVDNNGSCDSIPTGSINIGGSVATEQGQVIESVMMELSSNQPQYPLNNMTDEQGEYMFSSNTSSLDYAVNGSKNDDYLNGVSTIDLVMIQRHILGIEILDSPYKMVAADINNDELVNGIDLVELRKLILGIYSELPQNDSWRFINKSAPMDVIYPWPLNEIRLILGLDNDKMQEDFVGVKVGDVNDTAVVSAQDTETGNIRPIELDYNDLSFEDGELVDMTISSGQLDQLVGLQFTLDMDGLQFVELVDGGIKVSEKNFALLSEEQLTFSWNETSTVQEEVLFTIRFRATTSGRLSNSVSMSSDITSAEAYTGKNFRTIPITLIGQDNSGQEFALYQNNPNPFNGSTVISFDLPETSVVTITISDVTGRTVWNETKEYVKGSNDLIIDSKDLNTSGVLYYKVETGSASATKKMIVLK